MTDLALSRPDYEKAQRTLLSQGSRVKPEVWLVEGPLVADFPGGAVIVKDSAHVTGWMRWLTRRLLDRERKIVERLHGVENVPALLARIDRDAFCLSVLPGRMLDRERFRQAPRAIVDRIRAIAERMHTRRVYHLDLHCGRNIMLENDGTVHVVDFGAAWAAGSLGQLFFGRVLRWVDRQAPLKILARYSPDQLTGDEARAVLRQRRLRRLWIFGRKPSRRATEGARERLAG